MTINIGDTVRVVGSTKELTVTEIALMGNWETKYKCVTASKESPKPEWYIPSQLVLEKRFFLPGDLVSFRYAMRHGEENAQVAKGIVVFVSTNFVRIEAIGVLGDTEFWRHAKDVTLLTERLKLGELVFSSTGESGYLRSCSLSGRTVNYGICTEDGINLVFNSKHVCKQERKRKKERYEVGDRVNVAFPGGNHYKNAVVSTVLYRLTLPTGVHVTTGGSSLEMTEE